MTAEAFDPIPQRERTTNILNVRLSDGGWEWVDARIEEFKVNQTDLVKAALAFAASNPREFAAEVKRRKGKN